MKTIICNSFSLSMLPTKHSNVEATKVDLDEARSLAFGAESALGHASSEALFSALLGEEVKVNRVSVKLNQGTRLLVGQYDGPRLPEGATSLPEGATLTWFKVELVQKTLDELIVEKADIGHIDIETDEEEAVWMAANPQRVLLEAEFEDGTTIRTCFVEGWESDRGEYHRGMGASFVRPWSEDALNDPAIVHLSGGRFLRMYDDADAYLAPVTLHRRIEFEYRGKLIQVRRYLRS